MRSFEEVNKGRRTISKCWEKEEKDEARGKPIASLPRIEKEMRASSPGARKSNWIV